MIRISLLVIAMLAITYMPDAVSAVSNYKDYLLATLLSLLLKPWLADQFI